MSPAVCPYWTNWDDGWFTTSSYLDDADTLEQLEQFQVDNLLSAEITTQRRQLYHPQYYDARATAEYLQNNFPKLCWEYCFWFDKGVTSDETDDKIMEAVGAVIHAFHYEIVDEGELFDVDWLLPFVRAVREVSGYVQAGVQSLITGWCLQRVYGGYGVPWDDEYA
ncbi:hypothetical protein JCM24511_07763 [Saitozyma sp. JCM 24511]|nr:hypothetical protein JCM24511_07763 [Saitozyma sp. JCM 24511]